jgi:MraZ protein
MRDFRRLVIGGVEELCVDKQGRVKLSRAHMEYAGITKKVVIVGQGSRFEIWSEEELEAVIGQDFGDVTDELAESGVDFPI